MPTSQPDGNLSTALQYDPACQLRFELLFRQIIGTVSKMELTTGMESSFYEEEK